MKNLRQQNGFVCDNEFYVSGNPVYFAGFIDISVSLLIPFYRRLFWPNFHHTLNKIFCLFLKEIYVENLNT